MKQFQKSTYRLVFLASIITALSFTGNVQFAMATQGGFINPENKPAPPGSIPGTIDVSGSGAATYTIPLELPDGIGDTAPTLAITYNSQAGNSLLGYGWNLTGLSAITRVPKTVLYDGEAGAVGFNSNDRFALDGQRLLVVNGPYGGHISKYTTENYTFDDIRSFSGTPANPSFFRITTTDGTKLEYAHKILVPGTQDTYMWLLNKVTDRRGNYMEYVYASATGGQVKLSQIKYTGNHNSGTQPLHIISFSYTTKSSQYQDHFYIGGHKFENNLQLTQIHISNGRKYAFEVTDNKLQEISLYQDNILLTHPTGIEWGNEDNTPLFEYVDTSGEYLNLDNLGVDWSNKKNAITGDFTGDGKNEILVLKSSNWEIFKMIEGNKFVKIYSGSFPANNISTQTSEGHWQWTSTLRGDGQGDTRWGRERIGARYVYSTSSTPEYLYLPYTITDINGDGVLNLCFIEKDKRGKYSFNAYDLIDGALVLKDDYRVYIESVSHTDVIVSGDFNGDGRTNVLIAKKNYQGTQELSFDGDFKLNFVNLNDFGANPTMIFAANFRNSPNAQLVTYNGYQTRVFNATRNTQGKYTFSNIASTPYMTEDSPFAYPGDYNGDGLIDILIYNEALEKWRLYLSNGLSNFLLQTDNQVPIQGSPSELYFETPYSLQNNKAKLIHKNVYMAGDFNGNGKTDILRFQREIRVRILLDGHPSGMFFFDPPFLGPNEGLQDFVANYKLFSYYSTGMGFHSEMINGASFSYSIDSLYEPIGPPTLLGLGDGVLGSIEFKKAITYRENCGSFPILSGLLHDNGIPTLILTSKIGQGNPKEGLLQMHNDTHKNLVVSIINGNGLITDINYGWLHDPDLYTLENTPVADPLTERHLPLRVVSGIKTSMPISPYVNTTLSDVTYKYNTARFHRARGFLGFKQTEVYDDISKMRTISEFDIDTEFFIPYLKKSTTRKGTVNLGSVEYENSYISKGTGLFMQSQSKTTNRDLLTGLTTYNRSAINPNTGQLIVQVDSAGTEGYTKTEYFYNSSRPEPDLIRTSRTQGGGTFVEETAFEYYSDRNLHKTIDNNGNQTIYTYYADKTNRKTIHDATSGITEELFYDNTRRFVTKSETKKAGLETLTDSTTYDDFGRPLTSTCINGRVTTYTYDVYGQLTQVTNPDNSTTTFSYGWENDWRWYTRTVTSLGDESWVYYDLAGREVSQKSHPAGGDMVTVTSVYNSDGSLKETNSTLDGKTTYLYQSTGRLRRMTAKERTVNYSYSGNQVTTTVNGVASRERFNALGQLMEAIDPGGTITYEYHASGQPSTINYNGIITNIAYDSKGRQDSLNDPNAGLSTFTYDNLNRLVTQQDANGVTTTMTYDDYGRPFTKSQGSRVVKYTYDPPNNKGALHTMEDLQSGVKVTYNYDDLGRITSQSERIDGDDYTFSYTYDAHGRVATMTYPSGFTINNIYNGNYLTGVRDNSTNQSIVYNILYNSRSQVREYATLSGPNFFQTFDEHGYPKTTEIGTDSTNHTRRVILDYDFNPATHNLMSRTKRTHNGSTTVASETFTYDPLDRLTGWDVTVGRQTQNYHLNYANNGNITQKSDMGLYQYLSPKPNAVSAVSSLSGSPVSGRKNTIEYTEFNKVSRMQLYHTVIPSHTYDITYGPDDQRRKTASQSVFGNDKSTIYVNGGLYEERSNGEILHYIVTPAGYSALVVTQKNEPSVKDIYYLYNDHLGSLIAATQRGSTVLEEFSYDPWGRRRNPNDWNDYDVAEPALFTRGYTGHEHIGAYGLINMNGRVYDARLGRFLSPDPYVQAPDFSQSFNRYSYVWNNPLKYTDPDGEFVFTILAAIFAPPLLPLAIAADMGGMMNMALNSSNIDNGWKALGYYGIGAAAGAIGAGVGMGVSTALAGGSFWAGVAGTSLHVSTGFAAGFVSGAAGGFSGGFVSGFGNAAISSEKSFSEMLLSGLDSGWKGAIFGGIAGGIFGGFDAIKNDRNFWTGAEKQHGLVRINPDGSTSFADIKDVRNNNTRDGFRTNLDNNKGVSIDGNGQITIRHAKTINRITNMESSIYNPIKNVIIGRRGLSFTPWFDSPNQVLLFGYRYHSNPITSIKDLFYFRLR